MQANSSEYFNFLGLQYSKIVYQENANPKSYFIFNSD